MVTLLVGDVDGVEKGEARCVPGAGLGDDAVAQEASEVGAPGVPALVDGEPVVRTSWTSLAAEAVIPFSAVFRRSMRFRAVV